MLLGNYNGEPADPITPLRGIREAVSKSTRVLYARGADLAEGFPVLDVVPPTVLKTPDGKPGLRAEFFSTRDMSGAVLFSAHRRRRRRELDGRRAAKRHERRRLRRAVDRHDSRRRRPACTASASSAR